MAFMLMSVSFASCQSDKADTQVTTATAYVQTTAEETTAVPETTAEPVDLYISAAASLTESLDKIKELYVTEHPEVNLILNYGASGTLQTQIEEGATADVFISAAQKQMNALSDKNLILTDTRVDLLVNKVVLIVPNGSALGLTSFEDAISDKVSMIAIGDPESVPVGQYAKEIFTYLNGWDAISAKANLGTDVKAVLSWVETGNVDCGVVYATDAATSDGVTVVCEAPDGSHTPVIYPAAVVGASTNADAAKAFIDFLQTDEAAAVFIANGFTMAK
jgi:molybdenum ABC transporter, periplasmic molybdate-binding protein